MNCFVGSMAIQVRKTNRQPLLNLVEEGLKLSEPVCLTWLILFNFIWNLPMSLNLSQSTVL